MMIMKFNGQRVTTAFIRLRLLVNDHAVEGGVDRREQGRLRSEFKFAVSPFRSALVLSSTGSLLPL